MDRSRITYGSGSPGWVGRTSESRYFGALLASLEQGQGGSVLVMGEPGIGKSALLAEVFSDVARFDCYILRASADELGLNPPFHLVGEALRGSTRYRPRRPSRLHEAGVPGVTSATASWVSGSGGPAPGGEERVLRTFEQLCAMGPVLLVCQDLQWADEASLLVLNSLVRSTTRLPLLLVGTARPLPRRPELQQLRRTMQSIEADVLTLGPLTFEESLQMAGHLLGAVPGPALSRQIDLAGGHPLYVRELVDALTRERRLDISAGVVDLVPGSGNDSTPVSLSEAITDRMGFLTPRTVDVLRSASLFGSEFILTDLCAVLETSASDLVEPLEEAVTAGVLKDGKSRLRFRSALIREAFYESMPTAVRAGLHHQAGQLLAESGAPPERVAGQLVLVPDMGEGWILDWLASAGPELMYRSPLLTAELLQRVLLGALGDDPRREPLEAVLAMVNFLRGRNEDVERTTRQLLARTTDAERAAEMTWLLGYTLMRAGRFSEAVEVVSTAPRRRPLGELWGARLAGLHGLILYNGGVYSSAEKLARQALARASPVGDRLTAAYALHTLSLLAGNERDHARKLALIDEALATLGDTPAWTDCRILLMGERLLVLGQLDRLEDAANALDDARELAERTGTARLSMIAVSAAECAFRAGRWDDALAELDSVGDLPESSALPLLLHGLQALIAVHRGRPDAARAFLKPLSGRAIRPGIARANAGYAVMARAQLAEATGRKAEAMTVLVETLSDDWAADDPERHQWLPTLVRLALEAGDRPTAEAAAAAASADRAVDARPGWRAADLWCRGLLAGDPVPLLEAADYYSSVPRPLQLAEILEDAAAFLARAGDAGRARSALNEAAGEYLTLGAAGDMARADSRLRGLGIRRGARGPRKRPARGWDALTPTEQRIVHLVAKGLSNPDIASRLYLSRRTVQTHVSHILGKLGLRSRNEIIRQAAARRPPEVMGDSG
ncbi:ATP-binding protein [Streptomyces sp. NPDC060022]|uniref:ATP-binding protein n=1 Tax=Streptomyces sp. NPDC060022 TaxID=3347039 RepID=UPI0036A195E7